MIRTVALLGLVASASAFFGLFENKPWNHGLSGTFGVFDKIYRNSKTAEENGWEKVAKPIKANPSGYDALDLWVDPNEIPRTIGILTDENGQTSGLLIAISGNGYYDMVEQGFTPWIYKTAAGDTVTSWAICVYFAPEDEEARRNSYNESLVVRGDYVTVEGFYGKLVKIAAILDNLDSIWTEQACVPMMGQHYYYNMTTSMGCKKPFFSFFPIYDTKTKPKQIIAIGFMLFIKTDLKRFESPSGLAVQYIVKTCPKCMIDMVNDYGATTFHIYLVDQPRIITC